MQKVLDDFWYQQTLQADYLRFKFHERRQEMDFLINAPPPHKRQDDLRTASEGYQEFSHTLDDTKLYMTKVNCYWTDAFGLLIWSVFFFLFIYFITDWN